MVKIALWALSNYKAILIGLSYLAALYGGWHLHALRDARIENKALLESLERAKETESNIIKFNSDLNSINHEKDPCFNSTIPADTLRLLK